MEIKAGEFKAKCLELMDRVAEGHEEIIITKRGKPVAKLVPMDVGMDRDTFGWMKETAILLADPQSAWETRADANE